MNGSRSARPKLADVAKLAGVSLGSASRALNDPKSVKPKTLAAVRAAADQLAYVPDGSARSLALRRSNTIGAVVPTIDNPVYAEFVHALQRRLSRAGYSLICSAHDYDPGEEVLLVERLMQRGIDGLVLIGTDHDEALVAKIARASIPCLFVWSTDEQVRGTTIGFSNRRAMHQLTRHLVDLGHRRFAVLSGDVARNERARGRLAGIVDILDLAGLALPQENILFGSFAIEAGRAGLRAALALEPRPTALMCATDLLAAGAMAEAKALGIKVPEQLSITGFDDIPYAPLMNPPLTTVHVPTIELGEQAGDAMLKAVLGETPRSQQLLTTLVVRGSTGPAPAPE